MLPCCVGACCLVGLPAGIWSIMTLMDEEVKAAFQAAINEPGPILLNIMTNPNALALPPKLEWEQVKGFMLSASKLILGGRMDEVLDTIKANYKHLSEVI